MILEFGTQEAVNEGIERRIEKDEKTGDALERESCIVNHTVDHLC